MIRTVVFAAALVAAAPAFAQGEPPPANEAEIEPMSGGVPALEIGGEFNLLSDYRFRGVSRSDEDPAVQAGLSLSHESGLYGGVRGTSLRGVDSFRRRDPAFQDLGDAQLDLYAGFRRELGHGFEADGGLMYYVFAGGDGETDYAEPYASLSYLIGPAFFTAGAKYAPSQAGTGHEDMLYLHGSVDVTIPFRPWSFRLEAGHQDWGAFGDYWTWSAGARYHVQLEGLPNTELGLRYVDSNLPSAPGQDAGVVLSVEIGF
ncbi:MAG TPA: TorF family putative porin [Allosphingosinicella sp.]|nr:TorF family putative porin [Allosphingosinicella sp.]